MRFGGPIVIKEFFKDDRLASLLLLRPWPMAFPGLDLHVDLGHWRDFSTDAWAPVSAHSEGKKGHTGIVLVSRSGCLSSLILSLHFLPTTTAYTPELGCHVV
jgi:hypothetical protein